MHLLFHGQQGQCHRSQARGLYDHDHDDDEVAQHGSHRGKPRVVNSWSALSAYIFDIGHPYFGQWTAVETRYPLTSITRPHRGLKFSGHVFFF